MELLEQHFDTAFAAPDGVKKLRELILTLAMQGKLVPQDPSDKPASELLTDVEAEKKRLVKEGKIKAPKPMPKIKPEDVPYALPGGWEWAILGDLGIINPRNDSDDDITAGFVPMPLIPEGYAVHHSFDERPWREIKKGYTHFADGDVGMAKITPCFENAKSCIFSGLPNGIGAGTTELHIFRNIFLAVAPRFLLYFLKNPRFIETAAAKMTGSAGQKRVPTPFFTELQLPLPPLAEQQRIVIKIDLLMARCDALETLRHAREAKRLAFHTAALSQLLDTAGNGSADDAWTFITQHFGDLYAVKENVAELRKVILKLAVIGKLVPQDPNDPPSSQLLKEIEAEKKQLIKEGKIKASKPLPEIKPEEVPYALPQEWRWVRLGEVVSQLGDGIHGTPNYDDTGEFFFINGNNLSDGIIEIKENTKRVSFDEFKKYRKELNERTVLVSINGTIGNVAFFNSEKVILGKSACYFNLFSKVDKQYIKKLINSEYFLEYAFSSATGSTIKNVSLKTMREFCVPLPPLSEQQRLVEKIDQLMKLCDTLEQRIATASGKQTELLDAVMAQV